MSAGSFTHKLPSFCVDIKITKWFKFVCIISASLMFNLSTKVGNCKGTNKGLWVG